MNALLPLIRPFNPQDWGVVHALLREVLQAGQSYPYAADTPEAELRRMWVDTPARTFVACSDQGEVWGSYYLKANQAGRGSHVANCGYIVGAAHSGRGVAAAMCEHSQVQALSLGYTAMQFNYVVSTNTRAVALWQRLGFAIVGRVPGAFRHDGLGEVDTLVMHKHLVAGTR